MASGTGRSNPPKVEDGCVTIRLDTCGLLTARALSAGDYSLEIHRSAPCTLSLAWRRWTVVTFYLGPEVAVARKGAWGTARDLFPRGSVTVSPPGEAEQIRWEGPVLAMHLHLGTRLLARQRGDCGMAQARRLRRIFRLEDPVLVRYGRDLFDCVRRTGADVSLEAQALVEAVARHLVLHYTEDPDVRAGDLRIGTRTVGEVLDLMHGPQAVDTRLEALAVHAGLRPRRFGEVFRRITGATPHDYLLRSRLELAKHHMQRGEDTLTGIAHATGFHDQPHFTRAFAARIGLRPSAFLEWLDETATGRFG